MIGSLAQALLSVDLNLPMKGVVARRVVGRVAGRVTKFLAGMTWTLGRAALRVRMVLGSLDAIVMYLM